MDLGLASKVAIVNGASQGIGYAIARLLAEEGARVAITARRDAMLHAAAERIRSETSDDVIAIQAISARPLIVSASSRTLPPKPRWGSESSSPSSATAKRFWKTKWIC